jgi:hypothetical protein
MLQGKPAFMDQSVLCNMRSEDQMSGILTVFPMLKDLAMGFGISHVLWFAWIGIAMLRRPHS